MGDATILRRSMQRIEVASRTFQGEIVPPCTLAELARTYKDLFCRLYTFYAVLFDSHQGMLPLTPIAEVPCNPEIEALCAANHACDRSQNVLREVYEHLPNMKSLDSEVRNRVHGSVAPPQLRREISFMLSELDTIARRFPVADPAPPKKVVPVIPAGVKTPRPAEEAGEEKAPIRKKKRPAPVE